MCDTSSLDLESHTTGSVENTFKINYFNEPWEWPDFIFFFPVWFSFLIPALTEIQGFYVAMSCTNILEKLITACIWGSEQDRKPF